MEGLEELAKMEYPGRFIIIGGLEEEGDIVIYGLSGRSEGSKARVLKANKAGTRVYTEPTDQEKIAKGDPALLIYNAMRFMDYRTIVSNGAQTDLIFNVNDVFGRINEGSEVPIENLLRLSFRYPYMMETKDGREIDLTEFEPDKPIYTPRISGVIDHSDCRAVLHIVKRINEDEEAHQFFEFDVTEKGKGYLIATYDGPNPAEGPVPSFNGAPRQISFGKETSIKNIVEAVYEAIGDFAVGVAGASDGGKGLYIKNLHEKGE